MVGFWNRSASVSLVLSLLAFSSVAACSFMVDTGKLSGGRGAEDGSVLQSGNDKEGAPDSSANALTDADTRDVGGGAPEAYCGSVSGLFCSDFDTAVAPSFGWNRPYANGGASASAIASGEPARAGVLRVLTPKVTGGNQAQFGVIQGVASGLGTGLDLEFDFRASMDSWAGRTKVSSVLWIVGDTGAQNFRLLWEVDPAAPRTTIYSETYNGSTRTGSTALPDMPFVTLGQWTHVRLHLSPGATPTLSVYYDGVTVLSNVAVLATAVAPTMELQLGAIFLGAASEPWSLDYNNVWLH